MGDQTPMQDTAPTDERKIAFETDPLTPFAIDFAPLFGLTSDSMSRNVYLIFGWEFQ